jgi:hypothetical protein
LCLLLTDAVLDGDLGERSASALREDVDLDHLPLQSGDHYAQAGGGDHGSNRLAHIHDAVLLRIGLEDVDQVLVDVLRLRRPIPQCPWLLRATGSYSASLQLDACNEALTVKYNVPVARSQAGLSPRSHAASSRSSTRTPSGLGIVTQTSRLYSGYNKGH